MRDRLRRALLKALWVLNRLSWHPEPEEFSRLLDIGQQTLDALVADLRSEGLVDVRDDSTVHLTAKGRKGLVVVVTAGTFDILHGGHVFTLERAKAQGDVLAVVLARDANVRRIKGRDPILDERERVTLVSALKPVDLAILGDPEDPVRPLLELAPDVIVLGFNQPHDEKELTQRLADHGLHPRIVRLSEFREDPGSSSAILREVVERYLSGELAPVLNGSSGDRSSPNQRSK